MGQMSFDDMVRQAQKGKPEYLAKHATLQAKAMAVQERQLLEAREANAALKAENRALANRVRKLEKRLEQAEPALASERQRNANIAHLVYRHRRAVPGLDKLVAETTGETDDASET